MKVFNKKCLGLNFMYYIELILLTKPEYLSTDTLM